MTRTLARPSEQLVDHSAPMLGDPHLVTRTVKVKWIGERSPLDEPLIRFRMINGDFTEQQKKLIRAAAARANTTIHRIRRLTKDRDGLSQDYEWGMDRGFVREMPFKDADKIKSFPCGHEFVILGHEEENPKSLSLPPKGGDNVRVYTETLLETEKMDMYGQVKAK